MSYPEGSEVLVISLSKRGRVSGRGSDGRYKVVLGSMTVVCAEDDLRPAEHEKTRGRRAAPAVDRQETRATGDEATRSVDLHGQTVEEALRRVEEEIDRALRAGAATLTIVHGKGSGRVRAAVHRYLQRLPVVAAFRLLPENTGATRVWFRG